MTPEAHFQARDWKRMGLLLSGIGISTLGDFVYLVALNLMVLNQTGSPAAVAGLWIIGPIAAVCTKFWSGSLIDRVNKRRVMMSTDMIRALLVAAIPLILSSSLWGMYVCLFLISMASSFFNPASTTYITMFVPPENRKQFNSLHSLLTTGSLVVGPAIAGILLVYSSPDIAIYFNAVSFLLSAIIISLSPDLENQSSLTVETTHLLDTLRKDWKLVFQFASRAKHFIIIYVLFQASIIFAIALDSQEVVFTRQVIGLTEAEYSLLVSITGGGYVAGSILVSLFHKHMKTKYMIGIGMLLMSIGYLVYAFSSAFSIAALGFIVLGIFSSIANTGFMTMYQNNIPVEIMGRAGSVFGLFQSVMQVVMTMTVGFAGQVGNVSVTVSIGAMCITGFSFVLCMCTMLFQREIFDAEPSITKHQGVQTDAVQ